MTDDGDADDDVPSEFQTSFASPEARAKEAREAALDHLSTVDPDDPNTSKIDVLEAEENAVSTWAKHAAKAVEDGYPSAAIEAHAGALADECNHFTKGNINSLVNDQRKQVRKHSQSTSGSSTPALDDWIEANLDRVIRLETTDNTQDTLFRWDFSDGVVETGTTKDGVTHFSWSHFRDEIYQGIGVNTAKPNRREAEEWRRWLADLVDDRGETRTTFGPRSHAVERLESYIRDTIAYGNKEDMVEREGVHLDADPANADPDRLCVMSKTVKRICDDVEIEVRGLQQELDSRGHTNDDVAGVSEGEYVNGSMVRFWVLDPSFADPAAYMEKAQSPAQAAQQQQQNDDGNDGGSDGGTPTPASATATSAPSTDSGAQLSSIGPDDANSDEQPTHSDEQDAQDTDSNDEGNESDGTANDDSDPHSDDAGGES